MIQVPIFYIRTIWTTDTQMCRLSSFSRRFYINIYFHHTRRRMCDHTEILISPQYKAKHINNYSDFLIEKGGFYTANYFHYTREADR